MFGGLRTIARGDSKIDFVGRWKLWFVISGVVLLFSLGGLVFRGLNLGLSFKGGTSLRATMTTNASVADYRNALQQAGITDAQIQLEKDPVRNERQVLVQSKHLSSVAPGPGLPSQLDKAKQAISTVAGAASADQINVEDVGPTWGKQISKKALQGLIAFLILVVIYISFRFELKMSAAAVLALFHDLIATAGIYALVGFQVSPATVVALLTILGYSLYDTVVVFDKVRENSPSVGGPTRITYSDMVNKSVNQVLMRSINTSLTSLIPVGALLLVGQALVGAEDLKDLALALLIGILVGTYSSVFIASPILAVWKEREPRYQAIRTRQTKGAARATPVPGAAAVPAAGEFSAEVAPSTNGPTRVLTSRPPLTARGRKKKRGKRKR
jgi:preprotein translocase subunit SecF